MKVCPRCGHRHQEEEETCSTRCKIALDANEPHQIRNQRVQIPSLSSYVMGTLPKRKIILLDNPVNYNNYNK